jgi:hypothetical protein
VERDLGRARPEEVQGEGRGRAMVQESEAQQEERTVWLDLPNRSGEAG